MTDSIKPLPWYKQVSGPQKKGFILSMARLRIRWL